MSRVLKKSLCLAAIVIMSFCDNVFAEEEIPQKQELEPLPKDSVIKRAILLNTGYLNGLEMSLVVEGIASREDYILRYGPGIGVYGLGGDFFSWPLFYNVHLGLPKGDFEYFFNNRLGTSIYGGNEDFEYCYFCDIFYEPSIGVQFNNFNLSLGYNFSSYFENSFVIRVGFRHNYETKIKDDSGDAEKENVPKEEAPKENNSRYFRPGIEINYPVSRSKIEFFDNSFPYPAAGAGLFFRIGPEYFYFTTGAYAKVDVLRKDGLLSADFKILGISLATVPLLDLEWTRFFVEVPLLLSFGSGQIRFVGGVLADFYAASQIDIYVSDNLGGQNIIKIKPSDVEKIEEKFDEVPNGNLYVVLGLDIDIMRHWGIGVKCLILGGSLDEESYSDIDMKGIEPSHFQTRVSTYFVF